MKIQIKYLIFFKKILDFNKQQKGNGLPRMFARQDKVSNRSRASDLLTPNFQLPIALEQVKASNK